MDHDPMKYLHTFIVNLTFHVDKGDQRGEQKHNDEGHREANRR